MIISSQVPKQSLGYYGGYPAQGYIPDKHRPPETTIREIPAWCGWWWVPFRGQMDACQPYTKEELDRMTKSDLNKIRSKNPDLAREAETRIIGVTEDEIKFHPDRYRDLTTYQEHSWWSKWAGPGTVRDVQRAGKWVLNPGETATKWFLGGLLFLMVYRVKTKR